MSTKIPDHHLSLETVIAETEFICGEAEAMAGCTHPLLVDHRRASTGSMKKILLAILYDWYQHTTEEDRERIFSRPDIAKAVGKYEYAEQAIESFDPLTPV